MIKNRIVWPPTYTFIDYPDNYSGSVIVFIPGCSNNCENCHNPEFQNQDNLQTKELSVDEFITEINIFLKRYRTNKLVLSGGDPLYKKNIKFTKEFLNKIQNVEVCIYTGHLIDYVINNKIEKFKYIKCGKYIPSLKQEYIKNNDIFQLSSTNQNFYDENYNQISYKGILYYGGNKWKKLRNKILLRLTNLKRTYVLHVRLGILKNLFKKYF